MRLIDADELKAFYAYWDSEYSGEELKETKRVFDDIVDRQPTAMQCKDCKHYNKGFCNTIDGLTGAVEKEDYCSRGEKNGAN